MKPKLLLVDDDHSVRESLTKLLTAEHYDVYPARDGLDALDHFRSEPADLVVLDLNLGTQDGWDVFGTMTEVNPFVPTVIITGEFNQRARAEAAGVEALVEKPIDVPVFLDIIRGLLAETSQQRVQRVVGDEDYFRHVSGRFASPSEAVDSRYTRPLRLSPELMAALRKELLADGGGGRNLATHLARRTFNGPRKPKKGKSN